MNIRIAIAGNPNCGKTTLFNALTGSNQYVGNWPGVTVEKKEGRFKGREDVIITDLPGIYSLSPYTPEEVVARDYLIGEHPDAILNIVDGTNLERNLYLTTQLMELGIPVVIAINMMDVVKKNGDVIDTVALSRAMGCDVVEISALKGTGIIEAAEAAIRAVHREKRPVTHHFSGGVEHALAHIEEAAVHHMPEVQQRWYAVKIFERDERVLRQLALRDDVLEHIEKDILAAERELDDDAESIIVNERYLYVAHLLKGAYQKKNANQLTLSDRIDRIVTNRILALPIFALAMFLVYFLAIGSIGDLAVTFVTNGLFGSFADCVAAGELPTFMGSWKSVPELLDLLLLGADGAPVIAPWLYSLIQDGIIGGVGAVLGFVPQLLILFILLSILEDCGYMARVAFIMDRIFRKFGLSGKSFIPLLVATGCTVPGIMASRTIEQERDRRMTVLTTGFIPCSAKMPMIGMIAAALFRDTWLGGAWVATVAYFIGIGAVVVSGLMLKKTKPFSGEPSPFVMELPAYHAPVPSNVLRSTWDRGWSFIKRAGTVIVAASMIIWVLNSLSFEGGLHYITPEGGSTSILQVLGTALAFLFKPLGFGNWQTAVATVLGLVAKEEIVGVLGSLASMSSAGVAAGALDSTTVIGLEFFGGNQLAGFSFMIFNLLCAPCFSAIGAIRREMNNWKWSLGAIAYMCAFAYAISLIVYQLGSWWILGQGNTAGIAFALAVLGIILYMLLREKRNINNKAL